MVCMQADPDADLTFNWFDFAAEKLVVFGWCKKMGGNECLIGASKVQVCEFCGIKNDEFITIVPAKPNTKDKIYTFFGKELFQNRPISNICAKCLAAIEDFHSFYEQVLAYFETLKDKDDSEHETNNEHFVVAQDEVLSKESESSRIKGDNEIKTFYGLSCNECRTAEGQSFETFQQLDAHYRTIHQTRAYVVCCNKRLYRKDRILDHIMNHVNPEAYKCNKCYQTCKSRTLLRIHMKQHLPQEQKLFQCKKCDRRFVLRSQLSNHEASHLENNQKKFICEECGKSFALNFVLQRHKLIHAKEKNFFCEVCAKFFSSKSSLVSHVQKHSNGTNVSKEQCSVCKQWYKNVQSLRTHERQHKDINNHSCATCGNRYVSKSSLLAHVRYVHLKTADFECNVCKQRFRRKLELKEHMARHSGKMLYSCQFCPKTFFSNSNFFAHRKNKHSEKKND